MNGSTSDLITKESAAELLGVSLRTFDRARERLGLRPVPSARVKPILFRRAEVLRHVPAGVCISASAPARTAASEILSLPALKRARAQAKKARGK